MRLCSWSLALASSIPVLGVERVCPRKGCPWPWPRALCLRLHLCQKGCRRLPFKLREKVCEVASRRCKGSILRQDLVDLVSKRLDQLDTCYAELKPSRSKRNAVGYESKPKLPRANVL